MVVVARATAQGAERAPYRAGAQNVPNDDLAGLLDEGSERGGASGSWSFCELSRELSR